MFFTTMITNFFVTILFVNERKSKQETDEEEDKTNYLESDEIHISEVIQRFLSRFTKVILVVTMALLIAALFVDIGTLMYLLT